MRPFVVFDLDDTLFPEWQYVLSGFRAVDQWLATQSSVLGFYEAACRLFHQGHRGKIFDEALSELGAQPDPTLVATMIAVYREHRPTISLHDDASWALEYFASWTAIGLLSDGYLSTQQRKVEALEIQQAFTVIVFSDEFGRQNWKPSPIPYSAAMDLAGRRGEQCVYVSDNPVKDFVAAKQLGWTTVRIRRPDGEYRDIQTDSAHEAHHRISSLHELQNLIR